MCWSSLLHLPVFISFGRARSVFQIIFCFKIVLRSMLPACFNVLARRSTSMSVHILQEIISVFCLHRARLWDPHVFNLCSGKHFHPFENLSCLPTASWCPSWGASSQNRRHYPSYSQTTALGKTMIMFTLGFRIMMLATFILATLTARSLGICWQWPNIWNVMNGLLTVFIWVVYNLVKETKCEQENDRIQSSLQVRASWVVQAVCGSWDGKDNSLKYRWIIFPQDYLV